MALGFEFWTELGFGWKFCDVVSGVVKASEALETGRERAWGLLAGRGVEVIPVDMAAATASEM